MKEIKAGMKSSAETEVNKENLAVTIGSGSLEVFATPMMAALMPNRQGRIVADNMALGNTTSYEGAIGTSIAKVFDMTVASTCLLYTSRCV